MDLRQLKYFREIADTGSINEAARRLNMSQPPLSYQLRLLEEELNVSLFERSSQGVRMTEAGKLLYSRAGELLRFADSTRLEVAQTGRKRVLRLGLTSTTVSPMMPRITAFARLYPEVNFEVHDGMTHSLLSLLLEGIIDVSVVRSPLRLDEVNHVSLCRESMIVVSSKTLHVENEGQLTLPLLMDRPLILYRRYEQLVMEAFHAQSLAPDVFCICDDARGAVEWVRAGLATAIFPASMRSLCDDLRVQELAEPALETEILLIWRKDQRPLAAVQDFLDVCLAEGETKLS